ncbi:hypothetical protein TNCV_1056651 [Trichonephila clavipes]|nr:hypothetical protein TNCV_1056651 [Trichonephila clavipes]
MVRVNHLAFDHFAQGSVERCYQEEGSYYNALKNYCVKGQMHTKSIEAQSPTVHVVRKQGENGADVVIVTRGPKLRDPSQVAFILHSLIRS